MKIKYTPEKLKEFENWTVETFNDGKLRSPVHLSGSTDNKLEEFLIETFKQIKPNDWVATNYRSHYHALLKGVPEQRLKDWILGNKSIHFMDKEYKIFSSAIVGGTLPVAVGIAMGIKMKSQQIKKDVGTLSNPLSGADEVVMAKAHDLKVGAQDVDTQSVDVYNNEDIRQNSKFIEAGGMNKGKLNGKNIILDDTKVWVFCGDMTSQTGIFHECFKYSVNHNLPIKFIIENNFLSTDTPTAEVWGATKEELVEHFEKLKREYPDYFDFIVYERRFPHYGTGKFIAKLWEGTDETKAKGF